MSDVPIAPLQGRTAAEPLSWTTAMETATQEEGYFHSLGDRHWAFFSDQGTTLLVSFESARNIRDRKDTMPLAQGLAAQNGWSHLCLIADGDTWFRDPAVYSFFDRQVDDAFFEDFDRVLFYGAGMSGYAACAYAVAAPGAQVLALNPRATLDPQQAGWDNRTRPARRLDFTSRYGYAPDMLEGVAKATVVHDTTLPAEAMHAALFRAPYITRLSARHLGDGLELHFTQMAILNPMIEAAMNGHLTRAMFAKLWRARRNHARYLNLLLDKAIASGRKSHEDMLCRSVSKRLHVPRYAKRMARLANATSSPAD